MPHAADPIMGQEAKTGEVWQKFLEKHSTSSCSLQIVTQVSFPSIRFKLGSWPNGIKLVVTCYHIKSYGSSYLVHPRAVWTGPCSNPRRYAAVHGSHQLLERMPRDP
jgi:hypothetical protein